MRHKRHHIALALLAVMLLSLAAGCSNKGVHMPKHRKRRHCDCPTFAQSEGAWAASQRLTATAAYDPTAD